MVTFNHRLQLYNVRTAVTLALALVVTGTPMALAQKVGVNCALDGGTDCTSLIPDRGVVPGILTSTVTVPMGSCDSIARVCVALGIEHSDTADLSIHLSHNATTVPVPISGTSPDLYGSAVFETKYDGQDGGGTWSLIVSDSTKGEYGDLNNWILGLCCGSTCGDSLVKVSPASGLITTEAGGTAQFDVELTCPPFAEVTIPVVATNDSTEGIPDKSSLVFNSGNWQSPQTVTVTGQDDPLLDGDIPYTVNLGTILLGTLFQTVSPADLYNPPSVYQGITPSDVALTNLDDETELRITKSGGPIVPGKTVVFTIVASNAGLAPVSGATVTDDFAAGFTCSWTCVGAGGGTCNAGPVIGPINDSVDLPPGASVTYMATCMVAANVGGTIKNTATITPPSGLNDVNPSNNSASVESVIPTAPQPVPAASTLGLLALVLVHLGLGWVLLLRGARRAATHSRRC